MFFRYRTHSKSSLKMGGISGISLISFVTQVSLVRTFFIIEICG